MGGPCQPLLTPQWGVTKREKMWILAQYSGNPIALLSVLSAGKPWEVTVWGHLESLEAGLIYINS